MEDLLKQLSSNVAFGVEGAAALIIVLAALEATWGALRIFWVRPTMLDAAREGARLRLARWLALALEFELAADILRTAVSPSWDEIGKLAAIATLRTLLNYFLQQEIRQNEARKQNGEGARAE